MQSVLRQMGHVVHVVRLGEIDVSRSQSESADTFKITPLGGAVRV